MNSTHSILVVDDDQEDKLILSDYFSDFGHTGLLTFAKNGQEAIQMLEHHNDENLPKLIVLDLNMPILNGTQTLIRIKNDPRLKNIPVVIFSTAENADERRKCLAFGATEYIVKPATYERGKNIVHYFLSFLT